MQSTRWVCTEVSRRRGSLNGRGEGDLDNRLGMESRKTEGLQRLMLLREQVERTEENLTTTEEAQMLERNSPSARAQRVSARN